MADTEPDVAALTVQLLSAYLANNTVAHNDIAELVRTTKAALLDDATARPVETVTAEHLPAVSPRKSLASPDHILSLIDGKPYKTLKRHLAKHGLTPASYRERYGLPASYPMVAPGFAAARRAIAEKIGLGRKPAAASAHPAPETVANSLAQPDVPTAVPVPDSLVATPTPRTGPKPKVKTEAKRATKVRAKPDTAKKPRAIAAKASSAANLAPEGNGSEGVNTEVAAPSRKPRGTLKLFTPKDGAADSSKAEGSTITPRAKRRTPARGNSSDPGQTQ